MKWSEDYLDPESERRKMLRMQIAQDRGGVLKFMAQLPRVASAGTQFNYSTGEAYIVGEILAGAIKQPVSQYLSMKIWVPCGMEIRRVLAVGFAERSRIYRQRLNRQPRRDERALGV